MSNAAVTFFALFVIAGFVGCAASARPPEAYQRAAVEGAR